MSVSEDIECGEFYWTLLDVSLPFQDHWGIRTEIFASESLTWTKSIRKLFSHIIKSMNQTCTLWETSIAQLIRYIQVVLTLLENLPIGTNVYMAHCNYVIVRKFHYIQTHSNVLCPWLIHCFLLLYFQTTPFAFLKTIFR